MTTCRPHPYAKVSRQTTAQRRLLILLAELIADKAEDNEALEIRALVTRTRGLKADPVSDLLLLLAKVEFRQTRRPQEKRLILQGVKALEAER